MEAAATTVQMHECAAEQTRSADSLLAQVEAEIRAGLAGEQLLAFQNAREQWTEYRDAHCRFTATSVRGGSLEPIVHLSCLTTLAAQRIENLVDLVCEGGGLTGTCAAAEEHRAALLAITRE